MTKESTSLDRCNKNQLERQGNNKEKTKEKQSNNQAVK